MIEKAFPNQEYIDQWGTTISAQGGMNLRDWFAGKAMQGMCANTNDDHIPKFQTYEEYVKECADCAYQIADAMIAARSKS